MQTYIAECETLIDKMKTENYQLKNQIAHLENINANLMQSVNAYIQLISSMSIIEERFVVTFMFDDTVYSILLVPDGEKVQIENPKSTEYTIFLGWSLSLDGELVDLNEIEITADTVIYAKIIRKYDVNFILDYEVYEHHIIEKGDTITATTPPSTNKRVFKGWSLDSVNVIDVTNYPITEHRTFFAVVETRHEVKFVYTRHTPYQHTSTLGMQYIGKSDTLHVPTPPTINGYNFSTWLINGDATKTISNPANYTPTGDTVFVAKYVPKNTSFSSTVRVSTNKMVGQYSIFNYLSNNGHGYVNNLLQLKNFAITVRVYAGRMNGATYTLTNSNTYVNRVACDSLNETLTKGTVYFSIGLMANGYVHM